MGLVCGLPAEGVSLGLWSELWWFWGVPAGGLHVPNPGLAVSAAVLSLSLAIRMGLGAAALPALTVLSFALIPPVACSFILPDRILRALAGRASAKLIAQAERGEGPPLILVQLRGLLETFLAGLLSLSLAALFLALLWAFLGRSLPPAAWPTLERFAPFAPLAAFLGVAASLTRASVPPYLLGLLAGCALLAAMRVF
jgi:hypothetical protein